jgi:hypothetical protein
MKLPVGCRFRQLDIHDLDQVVTLHAQTLQNLSVGMVAHDSDAMITERLGSSGKGGGIFKEDTLIAYALLFLPISTQGTLAEQLTMPVSGPIAELDGAGVSLDYRGFGLHRALTQWRITQAKCIGVHHLFSTVSPGNIASLTNLLSSGLHARAVMLLPKMGTRLLMHCPMAGWASATSQNELIKLDDLKGLRAAFADGKHGVWQKDGCLCFTLAM